jgi:hypothetical protein
LADFVDLVLKLRHSLQLHVKFTIDVLDLLLDEGEQFEAVGGRLA